MVHRRDSPGGFRQGEERTPPPYRRFFVELSPPGCVVHSEDGYNAMYCTNCGNSLMDSDKYCSQCGKANAPGPGGAPYSPPGRTAPFARAMATHKIAGVCSGLARYFDINETLMRLIFVLGIFVHGVTLWSYIILWVVMSRDDRPPFTSQSVPRAA